MPLLRVARGGTLASCVVCWCAPYCWSSALPRVGHAGCGTSTAHLVDYERRAVLEPEDAVGKTIVFRPGSSYPIDVVPYRCLTGDGQEARIASTADLGVKA